MSSSWKWVFVCVQGIGPVCAQVKEDTDWSPDRENGVVELRRLTIITPAQGGGFDLNPWAATPALEGEADGIVRVRGWAILWTAKPATSSIPALEEVWSDIALAPASALSVLDGRGGKGRPPR